MPRLSNLSLLLNQKLSVVRLEDAELYDRSTFTKQYYDDAINTLTLNQAHTLIIDNRYFANDDLLQPLLNAVGNCPELHTLELKGKNEVDDKVSLIISRLINLLRLNSNITTLILDWNASLSDEEVTNLVDELLASTSINALHLYSNSHRFINYLSLKMKDNKTIAELCLNGQLGNTVATETIITLLNNLQSDKTLKSLKIPYLDLESFPLAVSHLLQVNNTLEQLEIAPQRGATDLAALLMTRIAHALKNNRALRTLNLSSIPLLNINKEVLFDLLMSNNRLRELKLNHSFNTHKEKKHVEELLEYLSLLLSFNHRLKKIELNENEIDIRKFESILGSRSLKSISLNGLGDLAITPSFAEALAANTTLEVLNFKYNYLHAQTFPFLARVLAQNTTLQHLNMSFHTIDEIRIIDYLVSLMRYNFSLHTVDYGYREHPDLLAILNRNKAIYVALEPIRTFKKTFMIDTAACIESIISLNEIAMNNEPFNNSSYMNEHMRMLQILVYLGSETPDEASAFELLTKPFKLAQLQPIADQASLHLMTISKIYQDSPPAEQQRARYQLMLWCAKDKLDSQLLKPLLLNAFAFLYYNEDDNLFTKAYELQSNTQIISFESLIAVLKITIHTLNTDQHTNEMELITSILTQSHYHLVLIESLLKSPAFVAALQRRYPNTNKIIILEQCIIDASLALIKLPTLAIEPINAQVVNRCKLLMFSAQPISLDFVLRSIQLKVSKFLHNAMDVPVAPKNSQQAERGILNYLELFTWELFTKKQLAALFNDKELLNILVQLRYHELHKVLFVMQQAQNEFEGYEIYQLIIQEMTHLISPDINSSPDRLFNECTLNLTSSLPSGGKLYDALALLNNDSQLLDLNYSKFSYSHLNILHQALQELLKCINMVGLNQLLTQIENALECRDESPLDSTFLTSLKAKVEHNYGITSSLYLKLSLIDKSDELFHLTNLKSFSTIDLNFIIAILDNNELPFFKDKFTLLTLSKAALKRQLNEEDNPEDEFDMDDSSQQQSNSDDEFSDYSDYDSMEIEESVEEHAIEEQTIADRAKCPDTKLIDKNIPLTLASSLTAESNLIKKIPEPQAALSSSSQALSVATSSSFFAQDVLLARTLRTEEAYKVLSNELVHRLKNMPDIDNNIPAVLLYSYIDEALKSNNLLTVAFQLKLEDCMQFDLLMNSLLDIAMGSPAMQKHMSVFYSNFAELTENNDIRPK